MVRVVFSGLCGVVYKAPRKRADVVLVDPTAVGGPVHSATLMVENHRRLEGVPDAVVGDPGGLTVYGVWNLSGQVIVDGPGPFAINRSRPAWNSFRGSKQDSWKSMQTLPNFAEIASSKALSPRNTWPVNAILSFTAGSFEGVMPTIPHLRERKYNFHDQGGKKLWPTERPMALQCQVSFESGPVTMMIPRLRGVTRVTIREGQTVVITNSSAGNGSESEHGDAVYTLLKNPKRRKRSRETLAGTHSYPSNPDECGNFAIIT